MAMARRALICIRVPIIHSARSTFVYQCFLPAPYGEFSERGAGFGACNRTTTRPRPDHSESAEIPTENKDLSVSSGIKTPRSRTTNK